MLAKEVIALADELAPNVFSSKIKLFELNRLERRIRVDILGQDPATVTAITEEDLEEPTGSGPLASVSGREDPPDEPGDEIENPGTGQETGDGDPAGEGSGEDSGSSGGSESSGEDSGGSEGSGEGSGSSESSGDEAGSGDDSGSGSGTEDPSPTEDDGDDEPAGTMALEERYRDVYVCWMVAMYYWHMGEYEEYQNKKAMFDEAWTRFERDVCIELDRAGGYA